MEFPGVFVFGFGMSNGSNTILWNIQELSFVLSGISRCKVKKLEIPEGVSKEYILNPPVWIFSGIAHDRFAISGSAKIPGKIGCVVVGHIPRELSRYVWCALDSGAIISGKVISDKYKPSPLFQGGLEIPRKSL